MVGRATLRIVASTDTTKTARDMTARTAQRRGGAVGWIRTSESSTVLFIEHCTSNRTAVASSWSRKGTQIVGTSSAVDDDDQDARHRSCPAGGRRPLATMGGALPGCLFYASCSCPDGSR